MKLNSKKSTKISSKMNCFYFVGRNPEPKKDFLFGKSENSYYLCWKSFLFMVNLLYLPNYSEKYGI